MAYQAYATNLDERYKNLILQMFYHIEAKKEDVKIYDIMSYEPDIKPGDIVFAYGRKAIKACKNFNYKILLEFADVSDLLKNNFDKEHERERAFEKLKSLKAVLNSPDIKEAIIVQENLPAVSTQQAFKMLESAIKENQKVWLGVMRDGTTIRLTLEPEEGPEDVCMTFAEFYYLLAAMKELQIKELRIVPKHSFKNSPQRSDPENNNKRN